MVTQYLFNSQVVDYLTEINSAEVLFDSRKIFNMDESSFCLNPNPGKVLARRGTKNVYNITKGSEKDCYTVLVGGKMANILAIILFFE